MGSTLTEVHRQNISEFRVFLATKGKNGKELLGGVAGALNECIEKMDYGITVDESKQFDCEAFCEWCKGRTIRPRYEAVGKRRVDASRYLFPTDVDDPQLPVDAKRVAGSDSARQW